MKLSGPVTKLLRPARLESSVKYNPVIETAALAGLYNSNQSAEELEASHSLIRNPETVPNASAEALAEPGVTEESNFHPDCLPMLLSGIWNPNRIASRNFLSESNRKT